MANIVQGKYGSVFFPRTYQIAKGRHGVYFERGAYMVHSLTKAGAASFPGSIRPTSGWLYPRGIR
jgi:hypothetical protein